MAYCCVKLENEETLSRVESIVMFLKLLLLLTVIPITELVVLLQFHYFLSGYVGPGPAVVIAVGTILFTGVAGAFLAKLEGLGVLRSVQLSLLRGEMPRRQLLDAAMILVGAALLLTPGLLTDAAGITLLLPPTRAVYRKWLSAWMRRKIDRGEFRVLQFGMFNRRDQSHFDNQKGPVIDATVSEKPAGGDDLPPNRRD